jgi:hypothetical protein
MSDPIDYNDHVTITRTNGAAAACFNTIACYQSDMVFWKNEDGEPHSPTFSTGNPPPTLTYQVGPHATSGSLQPALALATYYPGGGQANPLPQGVSVPASYTCSLHDGESGIINVYANFYSLASQLPKATRGTAYSANLTIGGIPNFSFGVSNSNLPASLTVSITNTQQGPVLAGTPGQNDAGNYSFDLSCKDAGGNNVTQTYLLTVS